MLQFIKNKYFLITVTVLTILVVIGISTRGGRQIATFGKQNIVSTCFAPFQKALSFLGSKINEGISFIANMTNLQNENDKMKIRIDMLELENRRVQELIEENRRLREVFGFCERFVEYNQVAANIIAVEPGNWFNVFVIDKGMKDGIVNKSVVVTSSGLVGYVSDAGYISSKVIGLIDEGCVVSSRLTKTRDIVVVKGSFQLKNKAFCRMDNIPADAELEVGDMVETAGLGSIFPKGVLIGKVKEIRNANHDINRYAIIEPAVDFKRLEEVIVLVKKDL